MLVLSSLGVVYGDIGTSPLYALSSVFLESHELATAPHNVIGAVSLIIWLLMMIVTIKYVYFTLRADNNGEGGVVALLTLASNAKKYNPKFKHYLLLFGAMGAAMFFSDSVITPAISVLSAVEGLKVVEPSLEKYILPISVGILLSLFLVQRKGTGAIGQFFGYIICGWFATLFFSGLYGIYYNPDILMALNPFHALEFLYHNPKNIVYILGAAVLAVTGVEALYVDMGHFGYKPIKIGWLFVVFPALVSNYLGQGGELLSNPNHIEGLFFHLFPDFATIPAVILATIATVIASQAVITGAFSLVRSAMILDLIPRVRIVQTSVKEYGQIYIPFINYFLLFVVIIVVLTFQTSSALVAAYGIAVTGTMCITSFLLYIVCHYQWKLNKYLSILIVSGLLVIDLPLFFSSSVRIFSGGWLPLLMAVIIITIVSTWLRGRAYLKAEISKNDPELDFLAENLQKSSLTRVPRTAIYLCSNEITAPQALLHNIKHNMVLHETNIFLHVHILSVPWVPFSERLTISPIAKGFWRAKLQYGYMNIPNIPNDLASAKFQNLNIESMDSSYFLSIENIVPSSSLKILNPWRKGLFIALHRSSVSIVKLFKIPSNLVIELGSRITI